MLNQQYDNESIKERLYLHARLLQTVKFVKEQKKYYERNSKFSFSFIKMLDYLNKFHDKLEHNTFSNIQHIFQLAEKAREENKPEWFILTCIIHTLGKIMYILYLSRTSGFN